MLTTANPTSRTGLELQKKNSGSEETWEPQRNRLLEAPPLRLQTSVILRFTYDSQSGLQQMNDHFALPEGTETQIPLRPINSGIGSQTDDLLKYLHGFRIGRPYEWN